MVFHLGWSSGLKPSPAPGDPGSPQAKDSNLLGLPVSWRCSCALSPDLILDFWVESSPSAGVSFQGLEPQLHPEQSS